MRTASYAPVSELEQCRVKKLAQGQDSNSGSRSRVSEALPLSLCANSMNFTVS